MAFDAITTAEVAVGKPITNELLEKYINRDDFLNAGIGTLSAITISNPSFEVDSDGDGHPDNWTETFFTGGTGAIDTATSVHGAQSYKFTHPGGAGNGGGQIDSDLFPVSSLNGYTIEYSQALNGGAVPGAVVIRYNRNQSTIDEVSLTGSTSTGTTGVWVSKSNGFLPSSDANVKSSVTYMKLRLIGGSSDHSTAGTVNFDNVRITEHPLSSAGNFMLVETTGGRSPNTTAFEPLYTFRVSKPGGFRFKFDIKSQGQGFTKISVNGSQIESLVYSTLATSQTFDFPNATVGRRFKTGDEIVIATNGSASTFSNMRVGVKTPTYGGISLSMAALSTVTT